MLTQNYYISKLFILLIFSFIHLNLSGQIYESITVSESDELISDNIDNPNFVILDVRTPGEYNPQHLEGAILRNYYDSDFEEQLDALDKSKKYLIHCKTGGRSSSTLALMEGLNFDEVYNMLGGITQWNAQSLPTTDAFAPRIMFVSENEFPNQNTLISTTEIIEITLTNRANAALTFVSISDLDNPEFTSDFDLSTSLSGAEDYIFHIYYTPTDTNTDVLDFSIESNDGTVHVTVERTGVDVVGTDQLTLNNVTVFPNPTSENIYFSNVEGASILIVNPLGKIVYRDHQFSKNKIDVSSFPSGTYSIILKKGGAQTNQLIIIE